MEILIYLITGLVVGGVVAWLLSSAYSQKKHAGLEGRASSAEAVVEERGKQILQREEELNQLGNELSLERQSKVEALTRLEESEKHFKEEVQRFETVRKELSETFKALSLDALTKNTDEFKKYADEFIKLAEEKLKSQTTEGKKELIDQNIEAIGKTLTEVQKRVEDFGKTSGEKFTEVATLIW